MSIFSSILNKIFPSTHPAVQAPTSGATGQTPAGGATPGTPGGTGGTAAASSAGAINAAGAAATAATGAAAGQSSAGAATQPPVDVEQVLNGLAQGRAEKLNWRTSIVDLMKLLDLDSSFGARKSLASELGYQGDSNDSAAMNIWLHKQVMRKLAENGGRVPEDLKD